MNNEKLYTAADFASYHAGTMPVHDMHALEKAALEDSFLSDALDGYAYTNAGVADTESLNEKLAIKEKVETKVLPFALNKTWLRIAASIVVVFGLGYLFYNVNKKDDVQPLAKNEIKQEIKTDSIIVDTNKTISADELITERQTAISQNNTATAKAKTNFDTTTTKDINPIIIQQEPAPAATVSNEAEVAESKIAKNLRRDASTAVLEKQEENKNLNQSNQSQSNASNYYNYNGVVQTATGGPMQNATIKLRNSNIATQTDTKGRFNFRATDSIANVSIAAVGYDKKEALLNANTSQILRLNNKSTSLDEVVVTAMGTKKKSKEVGSATTTITKGLSGKVAGVKVSNDADDKNIALKKTKAIEIDSVRFNTEKKSFYNYVQQNIKPEFDDNGNEYKGSVILSFIINKKGKPTKIKVEQSLNDACNEQAITLLQQAPRWSKNLEERKRVEITF
jgi:hypothetical protein